MSSPRANFIFALAIALVLHAGLAVALGLYLHRAPAPDELAKLDLTSVDLSFAETVEETAAAVASAPSLPTEPVMPPPPPPPVDAAPQPVDAEPSPRQIEPKLPSPIEQTQLPEPVIVRQESKVEKRETRDEKPVVAASAPRQARVDAPPKPRRSIKPDYPRESRLRGEQGDVSVEIDVAANGAVTGVRIIRSPGFPLLEEAAVKAARGARFTPAKAGGKAVAATVRLTLNFKLK